MNQFRALFVLGLGSLLAACSGTDRAPNDNSSDGEILVDPPHTTSDSLTGGLPYRGVNLAGAEFAVDPYGNGPLPGTFNVNYTYPDSTYVPGYSSPASFLAKGMTTFRLPFRWERLQPTRGAAFDAAELARLTTTVNNLTAKGAKVILDPHNYARYGTALIGSSTVSNAQFADLWTRLATTFKGNPNVLFGLMNEPHDMPTEQWVAAAQGAINAIRATGATQLILVPGNGWTGASSWSATWYGTPNATAMLGIKDPGNNFAFEAHTYFDSDGSGTNQACVSGTTGAERLAGFTSWLRANGRRGFVGEFGASSNATCLSAIDNALKHIEANADVYLGWTYWAGGPWWGINWMIIEPQNGADVPQMKTLLPHFTASTSPPSGGSGGAGGSAGSGGSAGAASGGSGGGSSGGAGGSSQGGSAGSTGASCASTTYAATGMKATTGGASDGGWNLWSNGSLSTSHTFAAGTATLTVRAKGTSAAGVAPHMVVSVGGAVVGSATVSATGWTSYTFTFSTAAGAREIRVAFDNDAVIGSEDRNLFVESVSVGCSGSAGSGGSSGQGGSGGGAGSTGASCASTTYAATGMKATTGGASDGGWNLWSNGSLSTSHTFAGGSGITMTIRAKGTSAAGISPNMVVSIGGSPIGKTTVGATSWTDYKIGVPASVSGAKEIRVAFDNDAVVGSEDRNLFVESVSVGCPSALPPVSTVTATPTVTAVPTSVPVPTTTSPPPTPSPPSSGPIKIMPLGDSITLGVNGGYRNGLWNRLVAAGKSVDYVGTQNDQYTKAPDHDHEGHPGFTIGNVADGIDGWLASAGAPSHVLLMIGTNDVAWWCAQSADEVADTNAALIDHLTTKLPSSWIVVGSIAPLTSSVIQPNNVDRAQLGRDYNAALKIRVQARASAGKKVRFADTSSALTTGDLYDGVHPTEAAADKVAQVWFSALQPLLP